MTSRDRGYVRASGESPTPGFLVWRLSMKWRAAVDRAVAPLGLSHAQYSVLAALYGMNRSGVFPSQRELAEHTGLPRERFAIADGEYLSWHGSRTPDGIDYAAELVERARRH